MTRLPSMPLETQRALEGIGRDMLVEVLWRLAVDSARCETNCPPTDISEFVRDHAALRVEQAAETTRGERKL